MTEQSPLGNHMWLRDIEADERHMDKMTEQYGVFHPKNSAPAIICCALARAGYGCARISRS